MSNEQAPARAIWDVLTNYNSLHEYIPNIAASGAVLQPNGRIRIEQVGVISPALRITTRIVLEVTEEPYERLVFSKVESREFIDFEGTYSISRALDGRSYLEYSVDALPLQILPVQLVQAKIRQEVPPMLAAVRLNANKYHALRVRPAPPRPTPRPRLSPQPSLSRARDYPGGGTRGAVDGRCTRAGVSGVSQAT